MPSTVRCLLPSRLALKPSVLVILILPLPSATQHMRAASPLTPAALQRKYGGGLNADGTKLRYSTHLGGKQDDCGSGIALRHLPRRYTGRLRHRDRG